MCVCVRLQVYLLVAAVGEGVIADDTPGKTREVLEQVGCPPRPSRSESIRVDPSHLVLVAETDPSSEFRNREPPPPSRSESPPPS